MTSEISRMSLESPRLSAYRIISLDRKDCEYDVGEVNLINWENILKHNKDRKYKYIHVGSAQFQIPLL